MKKFYIYGNNSLNGEINISGSKNSILPILCASLLSNEDILIKNVPNIYDVHIITKLFIYLGSNIKICNSEYYINNSNIEKFKIPFEFVSKIRSSIWIIAPILLKFGIIETFFPGGCNFCYRPIDLHIKIFKEFGIEVEINNNNIKMLLNKKNILGTKIFIDKISVGATITAIILSVLAKGITTIENIANEPEIIDVINFLNTLGANIYKINYNKIVIYGVNKLHGGCYKILSDRIEAGTFLISGIITMGEIICRNINPNILKNVIKFLIMSGANIILEKNSIYLKMNKRPKSVSLETNPYPGFPTDLQPQFTILNSISNGISIITENVFSYRFSHINELLKMKANIILDSNRIICKGVKNLFGNYVYSKDLRSSVSLILAGLSAIGQTIVIDNNNYIDRGYENLLFKLKSIGANIIISDI